MYMLIMILLSFYALRSLRLNTICIKRVIIFIYRGEE